MSFCAHAFDSTGKAIYTKDIDGDGEQDYYIVGRERYLILHGEIPTPITLPPSPSYVVYADGLIAPFTVSDSELLGYTLLTEGVDFYYGDFDGDSITDTLFRNQYADGSPFVLTGVNGEEVPANIVAFPSSDNLSALLSDTQNRFYIDDINSDGLDDLVLQPDEVYLAYTAYLSDGELPKLEQDILSSEMQSATIAGSSAGQFRVNESGSATYSLAIATGVGTAGVAPQLSINYQGNSGNGLLGKGWSIGGLSGITRCRQTLATDGQALPINFTSSDRFCLDGQRLINVSNKVYGSEGAVYRTEIDSFIKVTSFGSLGDGPAYFTAERKDGSTSWYGNTANSRATADGSDENVVSWLQNEFQDSVGNRIEFEYEGDANTGKRVHEVRYAYGAGDNAAAVQFTYTPRPDYLEAYTAGHLFKTTKRLSKITSTSDGSTLREYNISYQLVIDDLSKNQVSLIDGIQECVGSNCLPALTFDWSQYDLSYGSASGTVDFTANSSRSLKDFQVGDFDGDGYQDVVWLELDVDSESDQDHQVKYALSNGVRFDPTTYTNGKSYLYSGANADEDISIGVLDYNADGRSDIAVYDNRYASKTWHVYLSTYVGSQWRLSSNGIDTGVQEPDGVFVDVNSDGLSDLVVLSGDSLRVYHLETGSAPITSDSYYKFGDPKSYSIDLPSNRNINRITNTPLKAASADFNGDGNVDIMVALQRPSVSGCKDDRTNRSVDLDICLDENGDIKEGYSYTYTASHSGHAIYVYNSETDSYDLFDSLGGYPMESHVAADFNGDGLTDLLLHESSSTSVYLSTGTEMVEVTPSGFASEDAGVLDLNQDGNLDVYWPDHDSGVLKVELWDSQTSSFATTKSVISIPSDEDYTYIFVDINGDNQPDFHKITDGGKLTSYVSNYDSSASRDIPSKVITEIDNGLGNVTNISYSNTVDAGFYSRLEMSESVNGKECTTTPTEYDENGLEIPGAPYCYLTKTANPNDFYSELNGPWALPEESVTLGKDTPVLDVLIPMYLVSKVESTSPSASVSPGSVDYSAMNAISYEYSQMKLQAAGRGMLGFRKISTIDEQTGVETSTYYRQDYPFIGMPLQTEVRTASNALIRKAANIWNLQGWNGSNTSVFPYQPYLENVIEETYSLENDGASHGDHLQTVMTESSYDNDGNATSIKVRTVDEVSGEQFTKETLNCFGGVMATHPNSSCSAGSEWESEKGRLTFTRVTNSRPGLADHVRESEFSYYDSGELKGLLHTETVEPNKAEYRLTTTYEYDDFGNIQKKTSSASGEQSRYTRTEYDASGRFAERIYNSLEHLTEEVVSRNSFGAPLQVNGLNGLISYITYDVFGRETYRYDSSGADTEIQYLLCNSGCIAGAEYKVIKSSSTGANATEYMDALGRIIRTEIQGFSKTIYTDQEYDDLGRVKYVSEPYFAGDGTLWTQTGYDLLGRPVHISAPDDSELSISYDGLEIVTVNDKGQQKTERKNVLGELVEVVDALSGRITYEYDSQGNLGKIHSWGLTNSSGNHIEENDGLTYPISVVIDYDDMGRKNSMSDPDKGDWSYTYTKFGELETQTNANGHRVEFTYDALGRMKTRIDLENGSTVSANVTWQYDSANNGVGQIELVEDSVSGYQVLYQYDDIGRNTTQLVDFDGSGSQVSYVTTTEFDEFGRIYKAYDALDDLLAGGQSGIENHYNDYGYLDKITDLASGDLIQQVLEQTARGQLKKQLLGNGATNSYGYDSKTGRLLNQTSDVLGVFGVQHISYNWDTLGNLTSRHNQSGDKDLRESFCYDDLNRLVKSHIGGNDYNCSGLASSDQDLRYNAIGNVIYKAGVGDYAYGNSSGPHAVTSAGGVAYRYDDNGNMTADDFDGGRDIDYTTFDKAERIEKGNHITEFLYGTERSRYYRKDTNNATGEVIETWYLGNIERIENSSKPGEIQWKRYLAGTAIYTLTTDASYAVQSTEKVFQYLDHLGSIDLLTDDTGEVIQQMSFDIWGQRRNSTDWGGLSLSSLAEYDTDNTTRGYTGHEMLDAVGIIHMNGRIYDPRLGRFMQADPFVQAAADTQMYNRYSYVRNNPLNATDPSGYFLDILEMSYVSARLNKPITSLFAESPEFTAALQIVGTAISAYYCGPCSIAFSAQFSTDVAYARTGDFGQSLRAGAISGASAAAFYGIGSAFQGTSGAGAGAARIAAHAMVGGITAELQGGKFGHGFLAAGFSAAASASGILGEPGTFTPEGIIGSAVIGGTASVLTGGKFANGAVTGAFSYVLNHALHESPLDQAIDNAHSRLDALRRGLEGANSTWEGQYLGMYVYEVDGKYILSQPFPADVEGGYMINPDNQGFAGTSFAVDLDAVSIAAVAINDVSGTWRSPEQWSKGVYLNWSSQIDGPVSVTINDNSYPWYKTSWRFQQDQCMRTGWKDGAC
ncbi:FG-GAP-like repeat-containing protein [Microbulbifer sp. JTAC008]|uniref:FG-GAP-like repeat-containing protein n=1 Tax=Microbulbifer sp. JTAC008 TaxID=3243374 RepID=UPI00403958F9